MIDTDNLVPGVITRSRLASKTEPKMAGRKTEFKEVEKLSSTTQALKLVEAFNQMVEAVNLMQKRAPGDEAR